MVKIAKAKETAEQIVQPVYGKDLTIYSAFYKKCKLDKSYSDQCYNNEKEIELNYLEFDRQTAKLSPQHKSILKKIAGCESGFQMKPNSQGNSTAFGMFQELKVHDDRGKKIAADRFTREGNIKIAISLFLEQGITPWIASKSCWGK